MNSITDYYLSQMDVLIHNEIKIRRKGNETFHTKKKVLPKKINNL